MTMTKVKEAIQKCKRTRPCMKREVEVRYSGKYGILKSHQMNKRGVIVKLKER